MNRSPARRMISRRTLRSPSSVEAYLQAGVVPRFIERSQRIESETRRHLARLGRLYERMRANHADDEDGFEVAWRALARRWSFADVNDLIAEHNEWYPVERRLPLNPRTRDYVTIGGRDFRRRPLDATWILERFPPRL